MQGLETISSGISMVMVVAGVEDLVLEELVLVEDLVIPGSAAYIRNTDKLYL